MNLRRHHLPAADFEELAAGRGNEETVARLRAAQLSRRMLSIRAVRDDLRADDAGNADLFAALEVITAAYRVNGPRAGDVLLAPAVGLWATEMLRRLNSSTDRTRPDSEEMRGYLGRVAIACALATGLDCEVRVFVADGILTIPGSGQIDLDGWAGWATVTVDAGKHILTVRAAGVVTVSPRRPDARFQPVPRLTTDSGATGEELSVVLDGTDPMWPVLDLPIGPGVDDDQADPWRERMSAGWRLLRELDPERARAIRAGLSTLVPLRPTATTTDFASTDLTASSADAFGAAALTLPRDGVSFAETLVHEFQHGKLSALLDLEPLLRPTTDRGRDELFYSPWRQDPRPLSGVLQGAFAYLGVTDFWNRQRHRDGGMYPHFEFARWRREVFDALARIRAKATPTPLGAYFLDRASAQAQLFLDESVPAAAEAAAAEAAAECWLGWRLRNLESDQNVVQRLAAAWSAGERPPEWSAATTAVRPARRAFLDSGRLRLCAARLKSSGAAGDGTEADRLYAEGCLPEAAELYKHAIAADHDDADAWTGLVMCRRGRPSPAASTLVDRPEMVRALHAKIATSGPPADPDQLSAWLGQG